MPSRSIPVHLAVSVLLSVLLSSCSTATPERPPTEFALSLQRTITEFLATHLVPGASVAVIRGGRTYRAVGGLADVEEGRSVLSDTSFRIASVGKTYTAALVMKLVESGVLELEDRVDDWLHDLPPHLAGIESATVEQLLSHTSGAPQTFTRDEDRGRTLDREELLDRIPPPVCEPGRCYVYADGNYILAGLITEAATGHELSFELQHRILDPLHLEHTFTADPELQGGSGAVQYHVRLGPDDRPIRPVVYLETVLPRPELHGIMWTTASDLARWGAALFGGGALQDASLERMLDTSLSRQLPCPEEFACGFPYGLGAVHYDVAGRRMVGHDGSSGAVLAHDLSDGTTIAILTNGGQQRIGAFLQSVLRSL